MPILKEDLIKRLTALRQEIQDDQEKLQRDLGPTGFEKIGLLNTLADYSLCSLGSFAHLSAALSQERFSKGATPAKYREHAHASLQKIQTASDSKKPSGCCSMSRFDQLLYNAEMLLQEADRLIDNPAHSEATAFRAAAGAPASLGYQAAATYR